MNHTVSGKIPNLSKYPWLAPFLEMKQHRIKALTLHELSHKEQLREISKIKKHAATLRNRMIRLMKKSGHFGKGASWERLPQVLYNSIIESVRIAQSRMIIDHETDFKR